MTIGTLFQGTGCITHPHGWVKGCPTCDYVMAGVQAFYRKRDKRNLTRLEQSIA